jgi:hypothetical protein
LADPAPALAPAEKAAGSTSIGGADAVARIRIGRYLERCRTPLPPAGAEAYAGTAQKLARWGRAGDRRARPGLWLAQSNYRSRDANPNSDPPASLLLPVCNLSVSGFPQAHQRACLSARCISTGRPGLWITRPCETENRAAWQPQETQGLAPPLPDIACVLYSGQS